MNYWVNKEARKKQAVYHTEECNKRYKDEIDLCVKHSKTYDSSSDFGAITSSDSKTSIILMQTDSVSAIKEMHENKDKNAVSDCNKIAVLNFASYKNPGGMFIAGSSAQEESLCHESYLYNVLSDRKFDSYYDWNRKHLNKALYLDRAIWSPDILFCDKYKSDVLTCAAPNYSAAAKYNLVSEETNKQALYARIKFALSCLAANKDNILVLGAYGCGVFGQSSVQVARIFKDLLDSTFKNVFSKVVFAIPDDANYRCFVDVFWSESY